MNYLQLKQNEQTGDMVGNSEKEEEEIRDFPKEAEDATADEIENNVLESVAEWLYYIGLFSTVYSDDLDFLEYIHIKSMHGKEWKKHIVIFILDMLDKYSEELKKNMSPEQFRKLEIFHDKLNGHVANNTYHFSWWQEHADDSELFVTNDVHTTLAESSAAFQWKWGDHTLTQCMGQTLEHTEVWKAMTDDEKRYYSGISAKEKEEEKEALCLRYLPTEAREHFITNRPRKGDKFGKVWVKELGIGRWIDSSEYIHKQPIVLKYKFTTLTKYEPPLGAGYPQAVFDFVVSLEDREHKLFRVSYDYLNEVTQDFRAQMDAYTSEEKLTTFVDVPDGSSVELVKPFYGVKDNLNIVFINCLFDLEIQRIISIIWECRKGIDIRGEGGRNTNNRVATPATSDESATVFNCRLRSDVCSFVDIPDILRIHLLGEGDPGKYSVPYHSTMLEGWTYEVHPETKQLTRPDYTTIKSFMQADYDDVKGTNTHVLSASFVSRVVLPCAHALNGKFKLPLSCVSLTELMLTDSSTNGPRPECQKFFSDPRSDAGSGYYAGKDEVLLRSPEIDKHHLASMFAAYLTSQNKSKMMLKGRLIRNIACSAQVFIVLLNNYKKTHGLTTTHPLSEKLQRAMDLHTHILAKLKELGIMSIFSHTIKGQEEHRLEKEKKVRLVREHLIDAMKLGAKQGIQTKILNKLISEQKEEVTAWTALEAAKKAARDEEEAKATADIAAKNAAAKQIIELYETEGEDLPFALEKWLSFCSDVGPQPGSNQEHAQMQEGKHDELNFLEMFTNDTSLENIIKSIISRGEDENGRLLSESLQNLIRLEFDFDEVCSNCNKPFWKQTPGGEPFYSFIGRSITVKNGQIKFKCSSCTQKLGYSLRHILKPWESSRSSIQRKPMDYSYNFIQYFINLLVSTFKDYIFE